MRRQALTLALVLLLGAGAALAAAQTEASFEIPFPFQAGGKKLAAGAYTVSLTADGHLLLKQDATAKETPVKVLERIAGAEPPVAGPRLVFDEVGDFAPSYTEYVTVYILSEAWFEGGDGLRTHLTKGAHRTKTVTAAGTKK